MGIDISGGRGEGEKGEGYWNIISPALNKRRIGGGGKGGRRRETSHRQPLIRPSGQSTFASKIWGLEFQILVSRYSRKRGGRTKRGRRGGVSNLNNHSRGSRQ